jgi:hypothetical protein
MSRMSMQRFLECVSRAVMTAAVDACDVPQPPFSFRPVWQCSLARCGRYYCFGCVRSLDRVTFPNKSNNHKFRCPLHSCVQCTQPPDATMLQCVATPTAFHSRCLPAPGDPARPLRIAKRFVITTKHALASAVWEAVRRRVIDPVSRGLPVAGVISGRDGLAGQNGVTGRKAGVVAYNFGYSDERAAQEARQYAQSAGDDEQDDMDGVSGEQQHDYDVANGGEGGNSRKRSLDRPDDGGDDGKRPRVDA